MQAVLDRMQKLPDLHFEAGKYLFAACIASVFPCDAIALTVVERSLGLHKGFQHLMRNGYYTSGVGLLRMQLDNALRLHGIANCDDPHSVACQVVTGTPLRKLKDRTGMPMTDKRLVEIYSEKREWSKRIYDLASGYVHLSEQHVGHFLARSPKNEFGQRNFFVGDSDDHVSSEHKLQLAEAFETVTFGVLAEVRGWADARHRFGTKEQLEVLYGKDS